MPSRIRTALSFLKPSAFRIKPARCPVCGITLMIKLANTGLAVRCVRCGASVLHMSHIAVLKSQIPDIKSCHVYELSSRGALVEYLKKTAGSLTCSEYFDDVKPGEVKNGVQCQNVEKLTHADAGFDVCTSTEVFEHVADDHAGFSEIVRVLKPGGMFVFTVPLSNAPQTVERARLVEGRLEHILPAEYHGDTLRGQHRVLVFRDYGQDITERLKRAGFASAEIIVPRTQIPWGYASPVVVAKKPG